MGLFQIQPHVMYFTDPRELVGNPKMAMRYYGNNGLGLIQ